MTLITLILFIFIHLFANQAKVLGWLWHGRFLSFASGISFAYVFVDLLPKLQTGQPILKEAFHGVIPYLDHHSYVIALFGLLFFFWIQSRQNTRFSFLGTMIGYGLFNFLIGASLADENNPDIQPLFLFTIAIGLHYFVNDHNLRKRDEKLYEAYGRWFLSSILAIGWAVGYFFDIPDALVALIVAFVSGGILMNVFHYEFPKEGKGNVLPFSIGALAYCFLILLLGSK